MGAGVGEEGEDSGRQSRCDLMEMKNGENVKHSKLHITEHTVLGSAWALNYFNVTTATR